MTSLEWTLLLTLWTGETVTLYTTQAGCAAVMESMRKGETVAVELPDHRKVPAVTATCKRRTTAGEAGT